MIILGFKKNLLAFFIIGILGTLGHFVYEWSGENTIIGLIFPVNESIWEHLKLIFYPSLIFFLAEYFITDKKPDNYIPASIMGIFSGMTSIIVLYYTISGVVGKNIDFINIVIFFTAIIITLCKRNKIILGGKEYSKNQMILLLSLTVIFAFLFMFWSYNPPSLGIFTVPD